MARALLADVVRDSDGDILPGALVYVFAAGTADITTNPPTGSAIGVGMFDARTGGSAVTSPITAETDGYVTAWVAEGINAVDMAVFPGSSGSTFLGPGASGSFKKTFDLIHTADVFSTDLPDVSVELVGSTYMAIDARTGRQITTVTTSTTSCHTVFNSIMSTMTAPLVIGFHQNLTTTGQIDAVSGFGIKGVGAGWKGTLGPRITAAAGSYTNSRVISVGGTISGFIIDHISVDAGTATVSAIGGTGESVMISDSSFFNGTGFTVNDNGADWSFFNSHAKQSANGKGAWNHGTSSDTQWKGGRISGGQNGATPPSPTVKIDGGDGLLMSGLHIVSQNGFGNTVCNSDRTSWTNCYFDGQGDGNNAVHFSTAGGINGAVVVSGCTFKGFTAGTGVDLFKSTGGGTLIVTGCVAQELGAGNPPWNHCAVTSGAGSNIFIDNFEGKGDASNGFTLTGLASFATTTGNYPRIGSNVWIAGALVEHATSVVASTQTDTSASIVAVVSITMPAKSLVAGTTYRLTASGRLTNTRGAATNYQGLIRAGASSAAATPNISVADGTTAVGWRLDGELICRSLGAAGTVWGNCGFFIGTIGSAFSNDAAVTVVDTTGDLTLALGLKMGTSNAASLFIVDTAYIRKVVG